MLQARQNHDTRSFIVYEYPAIREEEGVLAQNAGRTGDIQPFTVFGKINASGKYTPLDDVTAVDGSAVPAAIYMGPAIAEADIQAGDVSDLPLLKHGAQFDEDKLVLEGGLTLESIVQQLTGSGTSDLSQHISKTLREMLHDLSLIPVAADSVTSPENA